MNNLISTKDLMSSDRLFRLLLTSNPYHLNRCDLMINGINFNYLHPKFKNHNRFKR